MENIVAAAVDLGNQLKNLPNVPAVQTTLLMEQMLAGQQQMQQQMQQMQQQQQQMQQQMQDGFERLETKMTVMQHNMQARTVNRVSCQPPGSLPLVPLMNSLGEVSPTYFGVVGV